MSNPNNYTVGWICAISTEYVAAQAFLDERHEAPEYVTPHDNNHYALGKVGRHNVVLAVLPDGEYGISSAATVARDMLHSFPNVRIGLMVGIGGGAPSDKNDVRLGDIVVSSPRDGKGGVFQYDFGKAIQDQVFRTTGVLNQPPPLLRAAVSGLRAQYESEGHGLEQAVTGVLEKKPRLRARYSRPACKSDRLYRSHVVHPPDDDAACEIICGSNPSNSVSRPERGEDEDNPMIHYGTIASANQLMKDAFVRDRLAADSNVLCFEMEAAGLMNHFPCLVIRGICDYSDSHKNKIWQGYAAMVAAAYTKDLLDQITPGRVEAQERIHDTLSELKDGINTLVGQHHDQKDTTVLEWLTRINYATQQADHIRKRQPGTGQWFLESQEYQAWVNSEKEILFCPGIPGAGKTIITATVVDDLYSRFHDDASVGIAYLFCDYQRHHEQTAEDLVANILKQLAQKQKPISEQLHALYARYSNLQKRPTVDELVKVIHSIRSVYSRVLVIIDALDECQETDGNRALLLSTILRLQADGANIFLTSRFDSDVLEILSGSISLEIRARDEDVHDYLTGRIDHLSPFVLRKPDLQDNIRSTICQSADGMFLLARLHMDALAQEPTVGHIELALENLPRELDKTYDQAMTRIENQGRSLRELALKVLSWVTLAKRALSTAEVQHAVAVQLGESKINEKFIPDVDIMVLACAGLVTADLESKMMRLAHYTTQEYFGREQKAWFPHAQTDIAKSCITYLSFDEFAAPSERIAQGGKIAWYHYDAPNGKAIHCTTMRPATGAIMLMKLRQ